MTTRNHPLLILDRPCKYCKVLELKDLQHGGRMQHDQHGNPYVDFGKVEVTEAMEAEKGTTVLRAIDALRSAFSTEPKEPTVLPKSELKLGYKRSDMLPNLPGLNTTAHQGCAFCKVLRDDLISANFQDGTLGKEESCAKKRESSMEIVITEVTYQFRDFETYPERHANDPRIWLDALYVYFTVSSGVENIKKSLHYNFCTDASDPCAKWFTLGRLPVVNERLSAPNLDRIKALIGRALKEKPIENNINQEFLPTRLLDLESDCSSGLRLVITKSDPKIGKLDPTQKRYVALSYCWGSASEAKLQLKTTHDTLNSHLLEIKLVNVPKTISDAIQVCRCLGIRYLWVDALCIIQGSEEDWNKESFSMSHIYSNSFLELCVIEGDSCLSGFLEPVYAPPTVQINFRSEINESISGNLYLRMLLPPHETLEISSEMSGKPTRSPDDPSNVDFGESAWAERGWTFQEDQLSPRKLYFGKRMAYMSSGKLCEAADGTAFSRKTYLNFESTLEQTLSDWYNLVDEYTKRKLSFEEDRFPAISAFARTVCDRFPNQRYLAGLWESDLHKGLLWTTPSWLEFENYYKSPGTPYIAPSWSWACRPYNITWISGIGCGEDVKYSSQFTLNHAEILTPRENPYGRVSMGRLSIRGKLFKPPLCEHGRVRIQNNGKYAKFLTIVFNYILWSEKDKYIAHIFLDWDYHSALHDDGYPRGPVDQLSLLLVSRTTLNQHFMFQSYDLTDQEVMLGILIRPVPGMKNEYEKLGIWYSENRDLGGVKFWEEIPSQELILV